MIYKSIRIPKRNLIIGCVIAGAFLVMILLGWYFSSTSGHGKQKGGGKADIPPTATFLLDAGHGGKDDGASLKKRLEKDDTLRMVKEVGRLLTEAGETVAYTRSDDTFLELSERTGIENRGKYGYFISIHRNSAETSSALGVETYTRKNPTDSSTALAQKINDRLASGNIQFVNRGVKQRDFYVIHHSTCPAVLIEAGFISNSRDNQIFDDHFTDIAKAIADACLEMKQEEQAAAGK